MIPSLRHITVYFAALIAPLLLAHAAVSRPNILLVVADDMGHAGIYGHSWVKTPHFDHIAEQGMLFTRAFTPTADSAPSRAALLTGRNPWQLKDCANNWAYYPEEFRSWIEVLADKGYKTGYTGKPWAPGTRPKARMHICGKPTNQHKLTPPTEHISDLDYAANFKQFLDERDDDQPFCFWFGCEEPKRTFAYGSGYKLGGYDPKSIGPLPSYLPESDIIRHDMLDYAYEVNYFDTQLGKFINELSQRGLLENTIIIVTSGNGASFPREEHNCYLNGVQIPLAIMWKGSKLPTGVKNDSLVSLIDIAPTMLTLTNANPELGAMHPITGIDFSNILLGKEMNTGRKDVIIGRERDAILARPGSFNGTGYPIRGIIRNDLLYLYNFEPRRWPAGSPPYLYDVHPGPSKIEIRKLGMKNEFWELCFGLRPNEELYNIKSDPDCVNNLNANDDYSVAKSGLKKILFEKLDREDDPRTKGRGYTFDNYLSPQADMTMARRTKANQK